MTELPVLTIALPPNRGNRRTHWAQEARQKKSYMRGSAVNVGANDLIAFWYNADPRVLPLPKPDLAWTLYTHQRMDEDNLWARLKWPLDALVRNSIIQDDQPKYIGKQTVTNVIDRKNPRVELRITLTETKP